MSEKCKCGADAKYRMALSDDTCAECHIIELNEGMQRLVDAVENYYVAAYEHEEQLAAQRRTIATLRARLRNRKGGYWSRGKQQEHWLDGWRNRYDALRVGYINLLPSCDGYSPREARGRHRARIAAIRNFGALPGEPLMPGFFYDGAWHGTMKDGYKGRATFDHICNAWTWWVVGFAGYVVEESYQAARDNAEAALRKLGALP